MFWLFSIKLLKKENTLNTVLKTHVQFLLLTNKYWYYIYYDFNRKFVNIFSLDVYIFCTLCV